MGRLQQDVRKILCTRKVPGGHTISAVELRDGRFGVCIDQRLSEERIFKPNQLDQCLNLFLARSWEMSR